MEIKNYVIDASWSNKLKLKKMTAIQLSERKGKLYGELLDSEISLEGKAKFSKFFSFEL